MNNINQDTVKHILKYHIMNRNEYDEPTLECGCCGKRIEIGEDITYDHRGYTPYCDDLECAVNGDSVTCLEECWWDEEFMNAWDYCIKKIKGEILNDNTLLV